MRRINHFPVALFLAPAMLFTDAAQAMQIQQFDRMAGADQDEYIAELIQGAEKVLTDEGRGDQSAQVRTLFATNLAGDEVSLGMTEFYRNSAIGRVADAKRAAGDPNARRIEVEDAMALFLMVCVAMPICGDSLLTGFRIVHSSNSLNGGGSASLRRRFATTDIAGHARRAYPE